jgi:hypothetical protein
VSQRKYLLNEHVKCQTWIPITQRSATKGQIRKPDTVVYYVNPALKKLRQGNQEFEANLGYIPRPGLKKNDHNNSDYYIATGYD